MKKNVWIFLFLLLTVISCHGAEDIVCSKQTTDMETTLIQKFHKMASEGSLQQALDAHGTFNIPADTFGGKVFWETHEENGWKLQFNSISGWWRILNSDDRRVARGTSTEQLRNLLDGRPTSVIANYFDQGYRFSKTSARNPRQRTVILLHGWSARANFMQDLANTLAENGYDAYSYDYPSSECSLATHCERFLLDLRALLPTLPPEEPVFFLTHSMGGLVLRGAMAQMTADECHRISAIVMLGPPNRGSVFAYLGHLPIVNTINASLADMTPEDTSFTMNIQPPAWLPPVGIIAGRHDGKVAIADTRLPEPLSFKHITVNCTHPGLRNPANVATQVLTFFDTLSF